MTAPATQAPTSTAEIAYTALFALLQGVVGLATINGVPCVSRRLDDPTRVQWENTPALYINEVGEEITATKGFEGANAKQHLMSDLYLYVGNQPDGTVTSTLLNNLIQAVRTALQPQPGSQEQTLNRTVSHCFISGKIEIIEGVLNNQAIAIIPVNILTNR